jgi:hypothetical protein
MPKVYKYLGIIIFIPSNDHDPIHVHAKYGDAMVAVYLYVKNGVVQTVRYQEKKGTFPASKMRDLKIFVSTHKNAILLAYNQYQQGVRLKMTEITKRIK